MVFFALACERAITFFRLQFAIIVVTLNFTVVDLSASTAKTSVTSIFASWAKGLIEEPPTTMRPIDAQ
jgi:hypothetical protein